MSLSKRRLSTIFEDPNGEVRPKREARKANVKPKRRPLSYPMPFGDGRRLMKFRRFHEITYMVEQIPDGAIQRIAVPPAGSAGKTDTPQPRPRALPGKINKNAIFPNDQYPGCFKLTEWYRFHPPLTNILDACEKNIDHHDRPLAHRQSATRTPGWSTQLFEYKPLNREQDALRLIRILPTLSTDGLIQCEMVHATLESNYICLSYVWGPKKGRHEVLLNGAPFNVRENMWTFLSIARRKYTQMYFWIDAISIAQHNIEERNHQVMQMGRIYGRAKEVIAWLGWALSLKSFFSIVEDFRVSDEETDDPVYWRKRFIDDSNGYEDFVRARYWYRAWITQESVLARRLTFLACEVELEMEVLAEFMDTIDVALPLKQNRLRYGLKSNRLLNLLHAFQHQSCTVERDKVYSLLSLCEEGEQFVVDYDTSEMSFIAQILRICHATACLCSSTLLAATLCAWNPPVSEFYGPCRPPVLEVDVQEYTVHLHDNQQDGGATETIETDIIITQYACAGCGEELKIVCDAAVEHVVCVAQMCKMRKSHFLRQRPAQNEAPAFYLLPEIGAKFRDIVRIAGRIYERNRHEDGTVILGFTLETLLSISWCQYEDHVVTPSFDLCEEAHQGQTKCRILSDPSKEKSRKAELKQTVPSESNPAPEL